MKAGLFHVWMERIGFVGWCGLQLAAVCVALVVVSFCMVARVGGRKENIHVD